MPCLLLRACRASVCATAPADILLHQRAGLATVRYARGNLDARSRRPTDVRQEVVTQFEEVVLGTKRITKVRSHAARIGGRSVANRNDLKALTLREINVIATGREEELGAVFLSSALQKAALYRSSQALRFYLQRLAGLKTQNRLQTPAAPNVLQSIRNWVETDDFGGSNGVRDRTELLTILTGYPEGHPTATGEASLFPNLPSLIEEGFRPDLLESLIVCLRELGGFKAMEHLWETQLKALVIREGKQQDQPTESQNRVADIIIQQLCRSVPEAAELAWKIAEPFLGREHNLSPETLDMLLSWPEYIYGNGGLRPWMEAPLKSRLERWAVQIERDLGVSWNAESREHHPLEGEAVIALGDRDAIFAEAARLQGDIDFEQATETEAAREERNMGIGQQQLERERLLSERRALREKNESMVENYRWSAWKF